MQSPVCFRIGSRKRAWTSTQSKLSKKGCPTRKKTSQQQKTNPKDTQPTPKQTPKSPRREGRALAQEGQLMCQWIEDMNWILQKAKKHPTRQHSKIAMEVQNKQKSISSAETQDPPSQDPGDRTVKPTGHRVPPTHGRPCSELGCNPAAGTLPWGAIQRKRGKKKN